MTELMPPTANTPLPAEIGRGVRFTRPLAVARHVLLGLTIVTTFGAGVLADRLVFNGGAEAGAASSLTDSPTFEIFQATWNLIQDSYVATGEIDEASLLHGASRGMVESLGDTGHSRFLDPNEAALYEAAITGKYIGVGIRLDISNDLPVVAEAIDGSPAAAAGIRAGDVILGIDGVGTAKLTREEVRDLLQGEQGTDVTLVLRHAGANERFTVTITRQQLVDEPVSWAMLPGAVAHVRLSEFTLGASADLEEALNAVRDAGATGIVLDLRDNPGGLVDEAIRVASQFVPEGTVLYQQQDRGREPSPVTTYGGGVALDLPLTVLVNEGSASAAEIVGGALRDSGRAQLIGETTFGTGTVLIPFPLDDGSVALLGTAFWLTADGEQVWRKGVEPDRYVALPAGVYPTRPGDDADGVFTADELRNTEDRQLQSAQRVVVRLARSPTP